MALIKDFEIEENGLTLADAYHKVTHPQIDEPGPGNTPPRRIVFYLNSYVSQEARQSGKGPIYVAQMGFDYDLNTDLNVYEYAYSKLKTDVDQLKGAVDA